MTIIPKILSNPIFKDQLQTIEHWFSSNELLHDLISHVFTHLRVIGEVGLDVLPGIAGACSIHGVYPLVQIVLAYSHSVRFIIKKFISICFGNIVENTIF